MKKISLIAAMDENSGLGCNNALLCHLPADLAYFREITLGKPVIMGRKTFSSIGKPLPLRHNIVLSSQSTPIAGADVVSSLPDALELADYADEIMIIGGERVFREAMAFANHIYLTVIHYQFAADVYFPELTTSLWHVTDSCFRPRDDKNPYDLTFYQYQKVKTEKID